MRSRIWKDSPQKCSVLVYSVTLILRTEGHPTALIPTIRSAMAELDTKFLLIKRMCEEDNLDNSCSDNGVTCNGG